MGRARVSAIWLLRLESIILLGIALYLIIASFTSQVNAPGALVGEIVFALVGATGLFIASRGFAQKKSYEKLTPGGINKYILFIINYNFL